MLYIKKNISLRLIIVRATCFFIYLYQILLSPYIGGQCRFYPSCSEYAKEVLIRYGFISGVKYFLFRLAKCHPFHPGGVDLS